LVWTIDYTDKAIAQLGKLDRQSANRIMKFLDERLAQLEDPRSTGKALTGPLGGLWRYRIGDYRVICSIEDAILKILVVEAGHRKDIYR
jgi:mRNA interferase RelE/StbE